MVVTGCTHDCDVSDQLNQLSDCILLRIFKLCHSKLDIWRLRTVCKRWYILLADGELWRVSNLSKFKLDDQKILTSLINYLPIRNLQYLEIVNKVVTTDVLKIFLEKGNQLSWLRLNGCIVSNGDNDMLKYQIPQSLRYIDVRKSKGNFSFLESSLANVGDKIKILGVSTNFGSLTKIQNQPFVAHLPNLSILECHDCMWMNDHAILDISNYCRQLISLNVNQCLNVNGTTIHHLVKRCTKLKTLVLRRTSIRNEELVKADWGRTQITEIDLSHCYYIEDEAVAKVVIELASQLEYLRCAVTDQLISEIMHLHLKLKTLEIRRRHPVNISNIIKMLSNCKQMTSLDVSLTPIDFHLFKELLPYLPNLKWLSFAGHEILKTSDALKLVSTHCPKIEAIGINYYHADADATLHDGLVQFLRGAKNLKTLCVEGAYTQDTVVKLKNTLLNDEKLSGLDFCKPNKFKFPLPTLCLDSYADNFSTNAL